MQVDSVSSKSTQRAAVLMIVGLMTLTSACNDGGSGAKNKSLEPPSQKMSQSNNGSNNGQKRGLNSRPRNAAKIQSEMAMSGAALQDHSRIVDDTMPQMEQPGVGKFKNPGVGEFVSTENESKSTFAIDVDTASYTVAQQWLDDDQTVDPNSVRVEEYINSFEYNYEAPQKGLGLSVELGLSPFDDANVIARLALQAERVSSENRPPAHLTFVVDTSGSMEAPNRLPLVKSSLKTLVKSLDPKDSVAIVTYSDESTILLEPTSIDDRSKIVKVIDSLETDGSTNLAGGLATGYRLAQKSFTKGEINRVIITSDGIANNGLTEEDEIVKQIRKDAEGGIQLITVGVGIDGYNDALMETLADDGDGMYAYVNNEAEADRLFSTDLVGTLFTVARDAKIQVSFDPKAVQSYRLIGYENRGLANEDFKDDKVDAGEVGAGQQVTALYELKLKAGIANSQTLGTFSTRWKDPKTNKVIESELGITNADLGKANRSGITKDFKLALAVASWAELLRGNPHVTALTLGDVRSQANELAADGNDEVKRFANLVKKSIMLGDRPVPKYTQPVMID